MTPDDLTSEIQKKLSAIATENLLFHAKIPVARHMSKKNSRPIHKRGARSFIGKSDDLIKMEKYLRWAFLGAFQDQVQTPINEPIHAIYHFHFGPDISRAYALSDLSNLFEIVSDSLQCTKKYAGVIKNDRQIKAYDGSRKFKNKTSFLEVFLLKFNENTDLT